jgi:hypothetical protein
MRGLQPEIGETSIVVVPGVHATVQHDVLSSNGDQNAAFAHILATMTKAIMKK